MVRATGDFDADDGVDLSERPTSPPPAGAYAGWWTRADAAAAFAVAADRDGDDDAVRLEDATRQLVPPAAPWLEYLELTATFGAAGGGLAAIFLQETALVTLITALPLIAWGARAKRDALSRRFAAERLIELAEEADCANKKAKALVSADAAATAAAKLAADAVALQTREDTRDSIRQGISIIQRDLAQLQGMTQQMSDVQIKSQQKLNENVTQLNANIQNASTSALRAAKESGAVAGMLAKDVAASRVDQRESFELFQGLLAEAAEEMQAQNVTQKEDVVLELASVTEIVTNLEQSLMTVLGSIRENVEAVREGATTATGVSGSVGSESKESETSSSEYSSQLEALANAAAAAKTAAVAAERAAAAAERTRGDVLGGMSSNLTSADGSFNPPLVAKLDAEQWSLLGDRLTRLENAANAAAAEASMEAGKAVGWVRAGVREDIRGASAALSAVAEAASVSAGNETVAPPEVRRAERFDERRRPDGRFDERRPEGSFDERRPEANRFEERRRPDERRQEQVSSRRRPEDRRQRNEDSESPGLPFQYDEREAVPVAEESLSNSAFGRLTVQYAAMNEDIEETTYVPPVNTSPGISKDEAFENMQALLAERQRAKEESTSQSSSSVANVEKRETNDVVASAAQTGTSDFAVRTRLKVNKTGYVTLLLDVERENGLAKGQDDDDETSPTSDAIASTSDENTLDEATTSTSSSSSPRELLELGLAALRSARVAANDADSAPMEMLAADDEMVNAIDLLQKAAEGFEGEGSDEDSSDNNALSDKQSNSIISIAASRGNLGNALLARGRLQLRLSNLASEQERLAFERGVRAGADGAASFHMETAEESLVLAGRAFRAALSTTTSSNDNSKGVGRALCGWGAALALRGQMVYQSGSGAAEAAALAAAASEKYRAALESDADTMSGSDGNDESLTQETPVGTFTAQQRSRAFLDWGDALRLAADASSLALKKSSRKGNQSEKNVNINSLSPPGECWSRAEACYEEAMRWDREGGIRDAAERGREACRDAFR